MLSVLGTDLEVMVYFAEEYGFQRNVLGRKGWIEHLRLGLIDHDCELYLSRYDE